MARKVIVGGTWREYRAWCKRWDLVPERDAIFADTPEKLMGLELKLDDIVRLGPISQDMELLLKTRIR